MRKILDVFEVFLGIFEKTKEKKDREGSKSENREKSVSGSIKLPFLGVAPEKGASIPEISTGHHKEMGTFGLKATFSGAIGNGSFLTLKPSFPDLGDLAPVGGQRIRNFWGKTFPVPFLVFWGDFLVSFSL